MVDSGQEENSVEDSATVGLKPMPITVEELQNLLEGL